LPTGRTATRHDALAGALADTVALGVRTNQAFLAACLRHPVFAAGAATTAFVGAHADALVAMLPPLPVPVAAIALLAHRALALGQDPCAVRLPPAWPMPMRLQVDGARHAAAVQSLGGARYRVDSGALGADITVLQASPHRLLLRIAHQQLQLALASDGQRLFVQCDGRQSVLEDHTLQPAAVAGPAASGQVRAPMAGRIVAVAVEAGQQVAAGATLVVLEAMKMEHPALAPRAALVQRVCVAPGAQVAAGTVLVELE
jgi:geranyl-CoA carboxylase alpha subunit